VIAVQLHIENDRDLHMETYLSVNLFSLQSKWSMQNY